MAFGLKQFRLIVVHLAAGMVKQRDMDTVCAAGLMLWHKVEHHWEFETPKVNFSILELNLH